MSDKTIDLTTKEGYLAFHKECCDKMHEITRRKNADYTGGASDPFANFQVVENVGVCNVETGFMVRMLDKYMRICALADGTREAQVKDESIEDTLLDLANYAILLAGYLKKKRAGRKQQAVVAPAPSKKTKWRYHYAPEQAFVNQHSGRGQAFESREAAEKWLNTESAGYFRVMVKNGVYNLFEAEA